MICLVQYLSYLCCTSRIFLMFMCARLLEQQYNSTTYSILFNDLIELNRLFLAEVEVEEEGRVADRAEDVSGGAALFFILFCDVWSTALCVGSYFIFIGGGQGGFRGGIIDGVDAVCNGVLNSLGC